MRYYSSVAAETTLAAPCSAPATTIVVAATSGYPVSFPFTLCLEPDTMNKELVEVTAAAGTSLTVTRGLDGTSAVEHSLGAVVSHDHSARDFRESREHEMATVAHGATGAVVGTTNTQSLTNKDLTAGSNTFPSALTTDTELATAISTEVTNRNTAIGVEATARAAADSAAAAVNLTLTGAQTVTNKNLTSGTNTFPSTLATTTTAQTLTHKDLTDATNTFPSSLATDAELATGVATAQAYVDTRLGVFVDRYMSADVSIADSTDTIVDFNTAVAADVGMTYGGGTWAATQAGVYLFDGAVAWSPNASGARTVWIIVSPVTGSPFIAMRHNVQTGAGGTITMPFSKKLRLAVGDALQIQVRQTSGGALSLRGDAANRWSHIDVTRVAN